MISQDFETGHSREEALFEHRAQSNCMMGERELQRAVRQLPRWRNIIHGQMSTLGVRPTELPRWPL